jgi:uncharacterized protein (DUF2164 family)
MSSIQIRKKNSLFTLEFISKNKDKYNYNDKEEYIVELFSSLLNTKLLPFAFIDNMQLHFHAQSVVLLDDYLAQNKNNQIELNQCILLLFSISKQIFCLEQLGYTFYGLGIKDIIVVNNTHFLILNTNYITPINNDNQCISFFEPFSKPSFISPELWSLTSLPAHISYKSIYYSLAALIIYCLFSFNICKGNDLLENKDLEILLKPIYGSKLYYCLKRCLITDTKERILIYI